MQKKLIALAVAAAFSAPAFAETTVYGVVDAAVINRTITDYKGEMVAVSSGLAGSRIGVTAAEDLDNGMKAIAKVEYALDSSISDGVGAARQEMLALAGGFGTVAAGYLQTAGYDWQLKYDPTAGSAVSPLTDVNATVGPLATGSFLIGSGAAARRAPHALAYISPDMGGLNFAVNYSTDLTDTALGALTTSNDNAGATNKTTAVLASVNYAAGPLSVGGVYAKTTNAGNDAAADAATRTDMAVGASFDLGVAKLFGTYQNTKTASTGAKTDTAMSVSAVAPVGSGALAASYANNAIKSTVGDDNSTAMTVAYLQGLSKTTTAYAAYNTVTTKNAAAAGDRKVTILAVGVNKKF